MASGGGEERGGISNYPHLQLRARCIGDRVPVAYIMVFKTIPVKSSNPVRYNEG